MKIKLLLLILVFLLLINTVNARMGHASLLSAYDSNGTMAGAVAKLDLEIKPGKGRVFFESYPLSQVDTQISTRFAKQFACDFLDIDCSNLDFFYTISGTGPSVGGPSAGAAMTVLTIAVLDNVPVKQDVVMTGTINSGGIIGPVGSVKEKIQAANSSGFTKVLVPKWAFGLTQNFTLELNTNRSLPINDINEIFKVYNLDTIKITKVNHIIEALYYFTGKNYSKKEVLEIPETYSAPMKNFSKILCSKSLDLQKDANFYFDKFDYSHEFEKLKSLYDELEKNNQTNESKNKEFKVLQLKLNSYRQYNNSRFALKYNKPYSAASFCFVTNTLLRELSFFNFSNSLIQKEVVNVQIYLDKIKFNTNSKEINSIIALQTKQIVLERLFDAQEHINTAKKENDTSSLAYAKERIYSAEIWYSFFNAKSKKESIDNSTLANLCKLKIMEAQERITFLASETSREFSSLDEGFNNANKLYETNEYELCIQMAAQTKAQADLLMTGYHLYSVNKTELFDEKYQIVKKVLAKEISQNVFPIAALSYFEYAESLKDKDMSSALLYLEYALELSNLDMYFQKGRKIDIVLFYLEDRKILLLSFSLALMIVGIIMFLLILGYILFLKFRVKK